MIYTSSISVQTAVPGSAAMPLTTHVRHRANLPAQAPKPGSLDSTPGTVQSEPGDREMGRVDPQTSILASSPINDTAQAQVALQQARALIQTHPRAAILAQANAHSQSVERLLQ